MENKNKNKKTISRIDLLEMLAMIEYKQTGRPIPTPQELRRATKKAIKKNTDLFTKLITRNPEEAGPDLQKGVEKILKEFLKIS